MTDEQYESLRRMILDMKVEIAELKLIIKRQEETAAHRHNLLYEWCAPDDYKDAVDALSTAQHADIPDDLKKFFFD